MHGATNYLLCAPDTRYTGGFFAHYDVNKELDVYTSFMFTDDDTIGQIAPRGLFNGVGQQGAVGFAIGSYFLINCTNPLMTAQQAGLLCPGGGAGNLVPGQASVQIGRRAIEAGPAATLRHYRAYRMQISTRGRPRACRPGTYESVYAQYESIVLE